MNKFTDAENPWTSYLPAVSSSADTSASHPPRPGETAAFWDSIGKPYQIAFDSVPAQHEAIKWLIETLPPGSTVLDMGCGTGKPVCASLAAAGHHVHGVDVSPEMIRVAAEQVPLGRFDVGDVRVWEPEGDDAGKRYDAVVAVHSLIADVSREQIRGFFGRAATWLRPGGAGLMVFGTVPVPGESVPIRWLGRDVVCSGLSVEENVECIEKAGFQVVHQTVEKFMPKGKESGLCREEDVWEEEHLFVWAKKM